MCFRPAEADVASGIGPTPCPHCGKTVFPTEGLLPKKCPFCREELAAGADSYAPAVPAPAAPAPSPETPQAPAAPKAPTA